MTGRRAAGHVRTDLGEDGVRRSAADARDRHQVGDGRLERAQARLDLGAHGLDQPIALGQMTEPGAQDEALVRSQAPLQGRVELGALGAQPSPGQIGEDARIGLAAHDRDEHRLTPRRRRSWTPPKASLMVAPLKHLGDPVQLIGARLRRGTIDSGSARAAPARPGTG